MPLAFYTFISLLIVGPWLGRGYILTLDMVFTPELRLPEQVGSSYPFHALLHYLNFFIPADILQKFLLVGILIAAGYGAHRLISYVLVPASWHMRFGQAVGGIFYVINPFTYERLMAGQYAVLLGYALLPWFLHGLLRLLRQPSRMTALRLGLLATVIGIVSIHTLGPAALLAIVCLLGVIFRYKERWQQYATQLGAATLLFAVLSSYWLIPLLAGNSSAARQIAGFGAGDQAAFATGGANAAEKVANSLQLRGFWAERHDLFTLPWDRLGIAWHVLALLLIGAAVGGIVWCWRHERRGIAMLLGATLAAGALLASGLVTSVLSHAGPLAGFREPHKFAMLIALAYSLGLAAGIAALIDFWSEQFPVRSAVIPAAAVLLAIPFIWTATMLWGTNGQLAPRHYPAGWFAVNDYLKQQNSAQAIFLPWHLYLHTDFAGRNIANPAPDFFDTPVVTSYEPGLPGVAGNPTIISRQVTDLLDDKPLDLAVKLKRLGINYVIFAKENDYRNYQPLLSQPGFQPVVQTATVNLYQIEGER